MELILLLLAIMVLLILNVYQFQTLRDELKQIKQEENKTKQFKREHANVSKTNFRKYLKWANRCICKI